MRRDDALAVLESPGGLAVSDATVEAARDMLSDSMAANTKRAYGFDWSDWEDWCREHNAAPIPANPVALVMYIADRTRPRGPLCAASMTRRLSAISMRHRLARVVPNPCSDILVRRALAGVRRQMGCRPAAKSAATLDLVRRMAATCDATLSTGLMDRAVLLLGFAAALRADDLSDLRAGTTVWFDAGGRGLRLVVTGKRDQEGHGTALGAPRASDESVCAVRAVAAWMRRHGHVEGEPLFPSRTDRSRPLGLKALSGVVKRAAEKAGLDPREFTGHSLRSGHVTEAVLAKVPLPAIMATTRHRDVKTLAAYYHSVDPWTGSSASAILGER